ncbi:hypothetical protein EOA75_29935 [Mesorhizobium sp. M1A.F.Ca.IN.022.07.1.1]|uniref:hypothetical protein n=1 Tax=Mesorhizobium sp. M1A.F.Ca.IN.022.07.1.1 TaxID=2496767 RepID=UPI000FCB630A|nr:hypothetical protein [Mesorhizobium sp. M1A.F.Ca.IN.022.07.1.1]RUV82897.1 hypothetical protein EOA75_29935 [Mesorhizobium sp. M1A.F.Ca.IN.022.07.1.1]TIS23346.1 MAG: hypothetical protein E5X11_28665 [Mesorhizobium sp.]
MEFKNRHRLPRREHSIWGKIDLKAASDQVAAARTAGDNAAVMAIQSPDAVAKKTSDSNA